MVTAPVLPRTWSHGVPGEFEPPPGRAHSCRLSLIPAASPFARTWFSNKPQRGSHFRTCSEALQGFQERTGNHPSGAKAHVDLAAIAARLKSCPFKTTSKSCPFKTTSKSSSFETTSKSSSFETTSKSSSFETNSRMAVSGFVLRRVAESSALRGEFPPQVSQVNKNETRTLCLPSMK